MDAHGFVLLKLARFIALVIIMLSCVGLGCSHFVKTKALTPRERTTLDSIMPEQENVEKLEMLKAEPLYTFKPEDVDFYLRFLHAYEPEQHSRIVHLARKAIGQPYNIYLLGEFPFELYDADPLFIFRESDCLVFSEHVYAMALAWNWRSFFSILQRIRYRNGEISMLTRNHYTIPDWEQNNSWLVNDMTEDIAEGMTEPLTVKTNRKKFFSKYDIDYGGEETVINTTYIPAEHVSKVLDKLRNGDFVNVIRGFEEPGWCGHTGIVTISDDGTVNFLHSSPPKVREQPILDYMQANLNANPEKKKKGKAIFYGFKFLRFRDDALVQLKELHGDDTPLVTGPRGILDDIPEPR